MDNNIKRKSDKCQKYKYNSKDNAYFIVLLIGKRTPYYGEITYYYRKKVEN
jgi:hypothetical protein